MSNTNDINTFLSETGESYPDSIKNTLIWLSDLNQPYSGSRLGGCGLLLTDWMNKNGIGYNTPEGKTILSFLETYRLYHSSN